MCYALPGPRCSRHAIERLAIAEKKMKDATAARDKAATALKMAENDLDKAKLTQEMATAERDIKQAEKMLEGATANHNRSVIARDESLAAYKKRREELAEAKAEYDITPAGIEELRTGVVIRPDENGILSDTGERKEPNIQAATEAAVQRQERIAQMPQDPLKGLDDREIRDLATTTTDPATQIAIIKHAEAIMDANPPHPMELEDINSVNDYELREVKKERRKGYKGASWALTGLLKNEGGLSPEVLSRVVGTVVRDWRETPSLGGANENFRRLLKHPNATASTYHAIAEMATEEEYEKDSWFLHEHLVLNAKTATKTIALIDKKVTGRRHPMIDLRLGRKSTWGGLNLNQWNAMTAAGGSYYAKSDPPQISFHDESVRAMLGMETDNSDTRYHVTFDGYSEDWLIGDPSLKERLRPILREQFGF